MSGRRRRRDSGQFRRRSGGLENADPGPIPHAQDRRRGRRHHPPPRQMYVGAAFQQRPAGVAPPRQRPPQPQPQPFHPPLLPPAPERRRFSPPRPPRPPHPVGHPLPIFPGIVPPQPPQVAAAIDADVEMVDGEAGDDWVLDDVVGGPVLRRRDASWDVLAVFLRGRGPISVQDRIDFLHAWIEHEWAPSLVLRPVNPRLLLNEYARTFLTRANVHLPDHPVFPGGIGVWDDGKVEAFVMDFPRPWNVWSETDLYFCISQVEIIRVYRGELDAFFESTLKTIYETPITPATVMSALERYLGPIFPTARNSVLTLLLRLMDDMITGDLSLRAAKRQLKFAKDCVSTVDGRPSLLKDLPTDARHAICNVVEALQIVPVRLERCICGRVVLPPDSTLPFCYGCHHPIPPERRMEFLWIPYGRFFQLKVALDREFAGNLLSLERVEQLYPGDRIRRLRQALIRDLNSRDPTVRPIMLVYSADGIDVHSRVPPTSPKEQAAHFVLVLSLELAIARLSKNIAVTILAPMHNTCLDAGHLVFAGEMRYCAMKAPLNVWNCATQRAERVVFSVVGATADKEVLIGVDGENGWNSDFALRCCKSLGPKRVLGSDDLIDEGERKRRRHVRRQRDAQADGEPEDDHVVEVEKRAFNRFDGEPKTTSEVLFFGLLELLNQNRRGKVFPRRVARLLKHPNEELERTFLGTKRLPPFALYPLPWGEDLRSLSWSDWFHSWICGPGCVIKKVYVKLCAHATKKRDLTFSPFGRDEGERLPRIDLQSSKRQGFLRFTTDARACFVEMWAAEVLPLWANLLLQEHLTSDLANLLCLLQDTVLDSRPCDTGQDVAALLLDYDALVRDYPRQFAITGSKEHEGIHFGSFIRNCGGCRGSFDCTSTETRLKLVKHLTCEGPDNTVFVISALVLDSLRKGLFQHAASLSPAGNLLYRPTVKHHWSEPYPSLRNPDNMVILQTRKGLSSYSSIPSSTKVLRILRMLCDQAFPGQGFRNLQPGEVRWAGGAVLSGGVIIRSLNCNFSTDMNLIGSATSHADAVLRTVYAYFVIRGRVAALCVKHHKLQPRMLLSRYVGFVPIDPFTPPRYTYSAGPRRRKAVDQNRRNSFLRYCDHTHILEEMPFELVDVSELAKQRPILKVATFRFVHALSEWKDEFDACVRGLAVVHHRSSDISLRKCWLHSIRYDPRRNRRN